CALPIFPNSRRGIASSAWNRCSSVAVRLVPAVLGMCRKKRRCSGWLGVVAVMRARRGGGTRPGIVHPGARTPARHGGEMTATAAGTLPALNFVHIPKTAGTSLRALVEQHYPDSQIAASSTLRRHVERGARQSTAGPLPPELAG